MTTTIPTVQKTIVAYTGLVNTADKIHYQLPPAKLIELALANGEGTLASNGALVVYTGQYTGRSPNDRFIVDEFPTIHETVDWNEVNHPITPAVFDRVYSKVQAYLSDKDLYVFDGFCGADLDYRLSVRFITERASHNLFVHQLFIRPTQEELANFDPNYTLLCAPNLRLCPETDGVHSEAAVLLDIERKLVVIAGTGYAGEMKKSIFSLMNYLMPAANVLPMHCSANAGQDGKTALFFGLSGTGKTTLSADPERYLIGDDEHGWSDNGIFNFEGGCYAKAIRLSKENEPEIYHAIRFGALCENVMLHPETHQPNYDDDTLTENSRVGYPIDYIPNAVLNGRGVHPSTVIFLTADAFGVLPPISKLTPQQAQYHFISGYTSKLAGTERGITEPKAAFSACFGSPFMPRSASVYAKLLMERINKHNAQVYLVNTGWVGGAYGVGHRMAIPYTRAMIRAALSGALADVPTEVDPIFQLAIPTQCLGVPVEQLNPKAMWSDKVAYDVAANALALRFVENFARFQGVDELIAVGPNPKG
ncbi:MAG: phosphoenolpyruvate carboxykinase (ATP) [Vampirovibrio sp.]|nr:phosphoenolpyruvate carboxykinase (ATP) [Vampirovibrio sp.]